jgi:ABC-2 type transport system ATP-binding protein
MPDVARYCAVASPDPGVRSDGVLELHELRKRYGEVSALNGLSLSVPPGRMYGFLGPNGAGKTTAMRIVIGVAAADSGEVLWDGRPVTAAVRRRFGYSPRRAACTPR